MKVQIQHSIETENIPNNVEELVEQLNTKVHEEIMCRMTNNSRLVGSNSKEKILFAVRDMMEMQTTLQEVASMYDDIVSISHGYLSVLDTMEQEAIARANAQAQEAQEVVNAVTAAATAPAPTAKEKTTSRKKNTKAK
jgi:hypothetical protein